MGSCSSHKQNMATHGRSSSGNNGGHYVLRPNICLVPIVPWKLRYQAFEGEFWQSWCHGSESKLIDSGCGTTCHVPDDIRIMRWEWEIDSSLDRNSHQFHYIHYLISQTNLYKYLYQSLVTQHQFIFNNQWASRNNLFIMTHPPPPSLLSPGLGLGLSSVSAVLFEAGWWLPLSVFVII